MRQKISLTEAQPMTTRNGIIDVRSVRNIVRIAAHEVVVATGSGAKSKRPDRDLILRQVRIRGLAGHELKNDFTPFTLLDDLHIIDLLILVQINEVDRISRTVDERLDARNTVWNLVVLEHRHQECRVEIVSI
jgi:hypothetical protein